jgi:tripartite-type tricarboxylate transporter receptor subunit TctC
MARSKLARRPIGVIVATAILALFGTTAAVAQTYPTAPVKVVVPFGAGGATDLLARVFAEQLHRRLGQPFTVENRAGAGGQIAAAAFARAPADGYTLLFATAAPITVAPLLSSKVQYNSRRDFVPVAQVAVQPVWLCVNAKSPHATAADLIKFAKANPAKLSYGTSGVGTELHLVAEGLARSAGIEMVHVPFRGGAAVVQALTGEQVDLVFLSTASIAGPVRQGAFRALAVSSPQRLRDFPDVPTMAELGHPSVTMVPWWGVFVPAGTPQPIIDRLTHELEAVSKDETVHDRLKATMVQFDFAGPQAFAKRLEAERAQYRDLIQAAKLKVD